MCTAPTGVESLLLEFMRLKFNDPTQQPHRPPRKDRKVPHIRRFWLLSNSEVASSKLAFTGLHLSLKKKKTKKKKNKVNPHRGVLAGALRKVTLEPYGRGGPFQALPPEKPLIKGVDPGGSSRHDFPKQCSNPIAKSAVFALSRALPPDPTPQRHRFSTPKQEPKKIFLR